MTACDLECGGRPLARGPEGRRMTEVALRERNVAGSFAIYVGPMRRCTHVAVAICLAAGYALLLAWFNRVDFYHHGFFAHGRAVRQYEFARVIFIPYFAWTIYSVGAFANWISFGRETIDELPSWERYPLFFVAGAGLWHVVMFTIGLAGFDIKPVAVALSLGTMSLSVPHLAGCVRRLGDTMSRARIAFAVRRWQASLLWVAIATTSTIFLLVKGLYPGGGHDYYNHYFQFYRRVIQTGSILPNDVWYHFYYSKGAGLYFLGMLLTDPLAPQLVTTCFMACGASVVYALLRRSTRSPSLSLTGVVLYIGAFIYTPGPHENMQNGGWGILQKVHELTAVLLLAVVWAAYHLFRDKTTALGPWTLALHAAIVSIALLTLPLTLLAGVYLTGFVVWFAFRRKWRVAARPFAAGVTAAICLFSMAAINYHYTGIPSDQGVVQFWPFLDLTKVAGWGTMLEVIMAHQGATGRQPTAPLMSWDTVVVFASYLRLEIWWPILVAAAPFTILQLRSKTTRAGMHERFDTLAWSALGWFAVTVILVALFGGGRSQAISFYRLSTFSYAPTLCLSLLLYNVGLVRESRTPSSMRLRNLLLTLLFATVLGGIAILNLPVIRTVRDNLAPILSNAKGLATGRFSLFDAYQNEQGWPGTWSFGAIYPGIIEPWRIVGPNTRLWSFHIWSYCMLPACDIQEYESERLSPSWQTVLFGSPEAGIKALKAEGLNYFFFSAELQVRNDPLPISHIFSPDEIAKHLAVRWTDGTSYLLTWPNDDTQPIDRKFLEAYAAAMRENTMMTGAFDLKKISDYLKLHQHDLRPFDLPWCTNCQSMPPIDWHS